MNQNSNANYLSPSLLEQKLIFDSCPSGHLDIMPVCVLSEGAGSGAQIPTHLTRIPILLISNSTDVSNKTVKVCLQQACNQRGFSFLHNNETDICVKDRNCIYSINTVTPGWDRRLW